MSGRQKRDAISRSRFFLQLAKLWTVEQRDEYEACLEASIIFGRAAIHRFKTKHEKNSNWKQWWDSIETNPAVVFFKNERNWILKKGPPKVGQIIGGGSLPTPMAYELYYFENTQKLAFNTVEKHLNAIENLLVEAEGILSVS